MVTNNNSVDGNCIECRVFECAIEPVGLFVLCIKLLMSVFMFCFFYALGYLCSNIGENTSGLFVGLAISTIIFLFLLISVFCDYIMKIKGGKYVISENGLRRILFVNNKEKIIFDWNGVKRVFLGENKISFIPRNGFRCDMAIKKVDKQLCHEIIANYCKMYEIPATTKLYCFKSTSKRKNKQ